MALYGGRGRPKKPPSPRRMLKDVLPVDLIFEEDELSMYNDLIDVYLEDFEADDLTASDMDDIMDLAKNRILEFRLLKGSKGEIDKQLEFAATIERLSKKNEKLKESLSTRRKDRINPNEFKGFSIVDLAVAFDHEKKLELKERMDSMRAEEEELMKKRKDYKGNKGDRNDDSKKEGY